MKAGDSGSSPAANPENFREAARDGNLQGVKSYINEGGNVNVSNEVSIIILRHQLFGTVVDWTRPGRGSRWELVVYTNQ